MKKSRKSGVLDRSFKDAKTHLVLITSKFPYGLSAESFLEQEIRVLARTFDVIEVVPTGEILDETGKLTIRPLPPNVAVSRALIESNESSRIWELGVTTLFRLLRIFLYSLGVETNRYIYLRNYRYLYYFLRKELVYSEILRKLISTKQEGRTVGYSYWMNNGALALAELRKQGSIDCALCRAHGADLYDERQAIGTVPFRNYVAHGMDQICPVSEFGKRYLAGRLAKGNAKKLQVRYLGVELPVEEGGGKKYDANSDHALVVSCSRIRDFKRVDLIPKVLSKVAGNVHWVHFGDGPDRDVVEKMAGNLPGNISYELAGEVSNYDIHRFYKEHKVSLFLSFSTTEGLPVSMMEAISHGIPIVACGVQGVPELVTKEVGLLVKPEDGVEEMSGAVTTALAKKWNSEEIKKICSQKFDADKNYTKLAGELKHCAFSRQSV